MKKNDSIITLAWPETNVITAMAWYDVFLKILKINKNDFYKVGHAATVLVEYETGNLRYFDFGRYHTPILYARVRDREHDPDLTINIQAKFDENKNITNLEAILKHLSQKHACHGEGTLHGSVYQGINFNEAYAWAKNLQKKGSIIYGPFELSGTNCSRFVNQVFRAGRPPFRIKFRLLFPLSFSPLTTTNVVIAATKTKEYYKVSDKAEITKIKANFFTNFNYFALP